MNSSCPHFTEHRGATLTREELLNEVVINAMPSTSYRGRPRRMAWQKIEQTRHPQFILTVHGMGYKFAG